MYLQNKDDFVSFKNEMQGWYKENKRKRIPLRKYIFLTLVLLVIFITLGFFINKTFESPIITRILYKYGNQYYTY